VLQKYTGDVFKLIRNESQALKLQRALVIQLPYTGALPMNYVMGSKYGDRLITALSDWSELLDAIEVNKDAVNVDTPQLSKQRSLSHYFMGFQVRGGGKCFFLAVNTLFALKQLPLLNQNNLLTASNELLIKLAALRNNDVWFNFTINEDVAGTLLQAQANIIQDFNGDVVNAFWLKIVAHMYQIRIVVFTVTERSLNSPEIITPYFLMPSEIANLPTFFILNNHGHYYPLFPVQDIPSSDEHEFNIPDVPPA
jgi:hypothetical protein